MNLDCLNGIIINGLAIHIDISDIDSWNLNTGFTSISLSQWSGAKSDNINLYDFGLTAYDNGRVDRMYNQINITPQDLKVELYRVGYNTGITAYEGETQYNIYPISAITSGSTIGNYFDIDGGYLQGFFKLKDYNYELFPQRYNEGITIEIILRIDNDSSGMFFLMGARAEDKYNPAFSGESEMHITQMIGNEPTGVVGQIRTTLTTTTGFTGIETSEENILNAYTQEEEIKSSFSSWEDMTQEIPVIANPSANTKSNVIAIGLSQDKKITLKYIDDDNLVISASSNRQITTTGWTIIDLVFTPDELIDDYIPEKALCYPRRKGTLKFFVNGREFWKLNNFDEFYFRGFINNREKQLGVPYNISFGGGSFGLKHSWHYDYKTIPLYSGQSQSYIIDNFIVINNPLNNDPCFTGSTGGSYNSLGLSLSADTTTFHTEDECNPTIEIPIPVMKIEQTGGTSTILYEYYIEFDEPIDALSNRDLKLTMDMYDTGIFQTGDLEGTQAYSQINLIAISTEDISIEKETIYSQPISQLNANVNAPFTTFDGQEYEYVNEINGLLIDGETGYPVVNELNEIILKDGSIQHDHVAVTGRNEWKTIETTFRLKDNTANQIIKVGILLQSTAPLVENFVLYVKNFNYLAQDKLVQDEAKDNLLIQQNFDSSYKGGIQKLRIYDIAFNSEEVLHNAKIELKNNPGYNYIVSTGGRLIYR